MKRIKLVLNRSNSNVGLRRPEVEAALEIKVAFEVPSDRAIPVSVNRGNPAVISEANADVSRALRQMAKSLLPAESDKGKRRWLPALAGAER